MDYETGPSDKNTLAGLQPEAAWTLSAKNGDKVKLARLVDQSLPPGPIQCIPDQVERQIFDATNTMAMTAITTE
jgi:hypothetical protein